MQILPLIGLYWRRSQQINKLLGSGKTDNSHLAVQLLEANAPILKQQFPQLNEKDGHDLGLLDDAIATLKEAFAPPVNTQS